MTQEELKAKADAYIGHPYELGEDASVTARREAYIDGYNLKDIMTKEELKLQHCKKCFDEIGIEPCCKGNCVEVGLLEQGYQAATERARKFVGDLMLWANLSEGAIDKMMVEFDKYMGENDKTENPK